MFKKGISRRQFIKRNSVMGIGGFLAAGIVPSVFAKELMANASHLPPSEIEPVIDIHQHTNYLGRSNENLVLHQRTMGVTTTILQPAGHPVEYGSTYYGVGNGLQAEVTPNEAAFSLAKEYPGEFLFGANEVPDLPNATDEIEKYLKLGAKVIGECKFGIDCDSPEMQRIYRLAEKYDVPVLMHWQYNMYNRGFERFHKMLRKYKRVNFIGHAPTWWANIDKNNTDPNVLYPKTPVTPGGITDLLLRDYPNVFGDFSAGSGLNSLTRDPGQARSFLARHQDKLLFGSDCTDTVGAGTKCVGAQTIAAIRNLSENKVIERKILYENARRLFRI